MAYLLDTGFFYALLNRSEQQHLPVLAVAKRINEPIILPTPVTTEVAYLVLRDLGPIHLADFVESLSKTDFAFTEPTTDGYRRAANIIRQSQDAHIDFVDAILVAVAERLNITKILTIDQRHFRLFRPKHCPVFEVLP